MQLIIVSGLSGAGKTVALKRFEDFGWYCIDNLPLALVQPLVVHALESPEPRYERVAIGIDARATGAEIEAFPHMLDSLRSQNVMTRVVFLTASESTILARYNDTRRTHPLTSNEVSLPEAIALERRVLEPIATLADETLNTSEMSVRDLRDTVHVQLPDADHSQLAVTLLSFGYKHGMPVGVDFIFDARCLPNPYWINELRMANGRDAPVADYLRAQSEVQEYEDTVCNFLQRWLPVFRAQGRPYVTIAIGCTGGQHRSVYLVERMAKVLSGGSMNIAIRHREIA